MNMAMAVGITWRTEGGYVDEMSEKCIKYWTYNPSSKDINVKVEVTDSLKEVVVGGPSESVFIEAGTGPGEAKEINFCFKVPRIYEADCLIGNFLCEQTCQQPEKKYSGEILMSEAPMEGSGSGSGVSAAAAAPLNLMVRCVPYERNWIPAYVAGIVIVLLIIGILLYKEYSTPKVVRDEAKLKSLQEKVAEEKGKK